MADKALLVGINTYPTAPLQGCVDDVETFAQEELIKRFKFNPAGVRLLLNNKASTQNILDRLDWLVTSLKIGDRVLFYYSGHGAQFATSDISGEADGLNEVICPYDFDWSEKRMISDHQFKRIFTRIPSGVIFNWVSDSCHSGDLTKELPVRTKAFKVKTMPHPDEVKARLNPLLSKGIEPEKKALVNGILDVGFISGCKRNQTSADAEIGGRHCGALSYFLRKNLNAPDGMTIPLSVLVARVCHDLKINGYEQEPQAEGVRSSRPFLAA